MITTGVPYLLGINGGGGIHAVRDARQAIEFKGYQSPAVVVQFAGSSLETPTTRVQSAAIYYEYLHFWLTTVNASFNQEGSGRLGGTQIIGDPGSYAMISDLRLALYGKEFSAATIWQDGAVRPVKVYPADPPIDILGYNVAPDPSRIFYRMKVKTTWAIVAPR